MACVLVSWREIREGALTMIRFLRREILRCWVFGSREEAFQERRVRGSLLRVGVGEGVDGVLKSEVIEGCIVWGFLAGWGGGWSQRVFWRGPLMLHWEEYVWEEGEVS